jgi:hypothetical protein
LPPRYRLRIQPDVTRSLTTLCAVFFATNAGASALPTRDQNPLLAGFDLPAPIDARTPERTWSWDATFNWGSAALVQSSGTESLLVDAETKEFRLALERRINDRWSLALHVPYRQLNGGSLDSFIDNWHDAFGLSEGARPYMPRDRLALRYRRDGQTRLDTQHAASGLGDASALLSYQLAATPKTAFRTALGVKAPTGEDHWFTSSGSVDVSAIAAVEHALNERWSIRGQGALTWLGDGDLMLAKQRDFIWSAHGAVSWQATRRIELIAQLDSHQGVYRDTEISFLDDALALSLGGAIHLDSGWRVHLGVSEDIAIERSPDVVFIFGVSSPTRR